jgi:hypothetical protein
MGSVKFKGVGQWPTKKKKVIAVVDAGEVYESMGKC